MEAFIPGLPSITPPLLQQKVARDFEQVVQLGDSLTVHLQGQRSQPQVETSETNQEV